MRIAIAKSLAMIGIFISASVMAQETADDQADVWAVVEAQWVAEEDGDKKWIDRMLVDDFVGWSKNSPAPRNKASTEMWDRYTDKQAQLSAHELYPLAIVISGDTAVAHYSYTNAYEQKDGEVEISNGRFTDVLIRTEDGWKFIAWHGGDD